MKNILKNTPFACIIFVITTLSLIGSAIYKLNLNSSTDRETAKLISENIKYPLTQDEIFEGFNNEINKDNAYYYYILAMLEIADQINISDKAKQLVDQESFDLNGYKALSINNIFGHNIKNLNSSHKIDQLIKKGNATAISSYGYPFSRSSKIIIASEASNMTPQLTNESLRIADLNKITMLLNRYYSSKCKSLIKDKKLKQAEETLCDWIDFLNHTYSPEIKKDGRISLLQLVHYKTNYIKGPLNTAIRNYLEQNPEYSDKLYKKYEQLKTIYDKNTNEENLEKIFELEVLENIAQWDYASGEKDISTILPEAFNEKKLFNSFKIQKSDINKVKIAYLEDLKSMKSKTKSKNENYYKSIGIQGTLGLRPFFEFDMQNITETKSAIQKTADLFKNAKLKEE